MNGPRYEEARCSGLRSMAACADRFSEKPSMRGTISARCQVADGRARHAWPECDQERRYQPHAEVDGRPRVVQPGELARRGPGVDRPRATVSDPPGLQARLQLVRRHLLPARLRPDKAGCPPRMLSNDRLHGTECRGREAADGAASGTVATSSKNANASPATGRSTRKTSHHGTKYDAGTDEIAVFVPPRDKTPCFSGWQRPATGHLFRFTICRGKF